MTPFWVRTSVPLLAVGSLFPNLGTLAVSNTVLVQADRTIQEDLIAVAGKVVVEGIIDGDLVVIARRLEVTGRVTGDITGVVASAALAGEVEGSVRLGSLSLNQQGEVGGDLVALAAKTTVAGNIQRDLLVTGWSLDQGGRVEREVHAEMLWSYRLAGEVGGNVEVGAHRVELGPGAVASETIGYRPGLIGTFVPGWGSRAVVAPTAALARVIAREGTPLSSQLRAWFGVVALLRFLGILLSGLVLFGLAPGLSRRAVGTVTSRPFVSLAAGVLAAVATPLVALVALASVILIPLGVVLLAVWAFFVLVSAVPVVTALAQLASRNRLGLVGALLLGGSVWRLLRLVPVVGPLAWLTLGVWGLGAWSLALWQGTRRGKVIA